MLRAAVSGNIEVGGWVRSAGGSVATERYAGDEWRATMVARGLDGTIVDVRADGNDFDAVFEERNVSARREEGERAGVSVRALGE